MRKIKIFLTCLLAFVMVAFTQEYVELSWDELQDVKFVSRYNEEVKGKVQFPAFPPNIKKLEGRKVRIEGYIVPWDIMGKSLAISANPNKNCFFCGNAGPLSVMCVQLKKGRNTFKTDAYKKFTGTLQLNDSDIHQLNYILKDGEEVK